MWRDLSAQNFGVRVCAQSGTAVEQRVTDVQRYPNLPREYTVHQCIGVLEYINGNRLITQLSGQMGWIEYQRTTAYNTHEHNGQFTT